MESFDKDVRHFIYTTFAETALPPTTRQLSEHLKVSIASVENSLERLANSHDIVLAPGSHSIWMAHPFSGIPTNFVTIIGQKKYHGNGVWDIFGISAILQKNAEGYAPCGCGDCNQKMELSINLGERLNSDWAVHFVVPAARFWEKIGYTGATILPFSSKEHLDNWLERKGLKSGYDMPIQTCWELAQEWYTGRIERDWKRPDRVKAQDLFKNLGLGGDFWKLR